ncbi:TetR/AcrR family transcriptional regulator [Gammaproteobacteria bacterium]|jgi:AcrR family transcriptional regulator|nr:TetR/AcrR family transcriptional regulator [Gammaproteobacteria bacterium]
MVKKIKEKGRKKRSLIIEHAKNELLIHGVNSLSLRKISNDLGISHGNLHYYFKTKDDLLLDIFNEEITKLNKSISRSTNQNFSIEENAKSLVDAILNDTLDSSIQLWLLLIGESISNDNLVHFIQDENNLYETVLANQIKIINKKISDNDSIFIAKYMRCIIDGFCIELLYADIKSKTFKNFYKNLKENLIKLLINI